MDSEISKINNAVVPKPLGPTRRRPIKSITSVDSGVNVSLEHSSEELNMKGALRRRKSAPKHANDASFDKNSGYEKQVTDNSDEELDEQESYYSFSRSPNRTETFSPESAHLSRTTSPDKINKSKNNNESFEKSREQSPPKRDRSRSQSSSMFDHNIRLSLKSFCITIILLFSFITFMLLNAKSNSTVSRNQMIFSPRKPTLELIENVRTKFKNQDSYIWDEISSGINEVKTRIPKVPSIILLFANEMHTMDCLAQALANLSCSVLGGDSPLNLNPKDFGEDPGEILQTLKGVSTKKAVIIRDVLNINTEAIKALHNLCDRINPLIKEVIYIITMQAEDYELSQQKTAFVERQFYHKLSNSINEDVLMALVTRITDGAIISVQPETNLQYC